MNPVLLLAVYTFAFNVVFQVRWHSNSTNRFEFAIALFVGLMIFNFFAECINRSSSLIISNPNYVKKLLFPLEILPIVAVGSAAVQLSISFVIWTVFYITFIGLPPLTILQFPILLVPLLLLILGLSWFLAAVGTFLRDLPHIVGLAMTMLMFLSPIFYSIDAVPENYRPLIRANILSHVIEGARGVLMWGQSTNIWTLASMLLITSVIAYSGLFLFERLRPGFADVV